jgi:hypothetical protein
VDKETKDPRILKGDEHSKACLENMNKVIDDAKHELIEHVNTAFRNLDNRRKGREYNDMVFIEDQNYLLKSYHEELEEAFSYIDCEKEELRAVDIVTDRNWKFGMVTELEKKQY